MNKVLLSFLMGWSLAAPLYAAYCPEIDLPSLQAELKKKPARELAFFASWCASCKKSLLTADDSTLFIASFDEQASTEATVKALRGDGSLRCYWDKDNKIAQHYQVKSLPAFRTP